jgi:putative glycosyltransferase (TIGR04348 family)
LSPAILIATPYAADANNGNWRTAARWARLLRKRFRVIVQSGGGGDLDVDALVALHARRSHAVIRSWRDRFPHRPLAVALTGTDLYRDLPDDPDARDSLTLADRLIVLQADAVNALPPAHRGKARVVYQSAHRLAPALKPPARLDCVMVGHLRAEKDPGTGWGAWAHLPPDAPIRLDVIGGALDERLEQAARAAERQDRRVRWLGERPHAWTRQVIKRAHLLVVPSRMEGGANVIVEAVTAGTPVLASRVSGNIGMLGEDYAGYFPVGDPSALARLLSYCLEDPRAYAQLQRQCRRRLPWFQPERERAALTRVLWELLRGSG